MEPTKQEKINNLLFELINHLYNLSAHNEENGYEKCEFSSDLLEELDKLNKRIEKL